GNVFRPAHRDRALAHDAALRSLDPGIELDVARAVWRFPDDGAHVFAVGRGIGVEHADRALAVPAIAEQLRQDWAEVIEVNGAGNGAAAHADLLRHRVVMNG